MKRKLASALIVEDEKALRYQLARSLRKQGFAVRVAATIEEALAALESPPDLLLLDVRLGKRSGLEVAEHAAALEPAPVMIAISGKARNEEAFALARVGVRVFLPKPFDAKTLAAAIERAVTEAPNIEAIASTAVGVKTLREAQRELRSSMLKQAMALKGTQGKAADVLGLSRQAVGHMLHRGKNKSEEE